ncbi:type I DNA topoisomerase [Bdellovibrio bacteriovorus]|uniref:DNA topoisomerase 1 n=1 Tax=Bdellovibrio bacteriovorus (strain ATCC 15356 / DSM 50701 / NCIMB 9529 / HD100) TaxID=264462 RepID=Q6MP96_BDEBA|nr:type I DNA topoisomerase [Bdellovibrio bacteriovorus]AHZ86217.1 DNA topoisomerase I [Bdellovibrio bacteriovorus]BEV67454.1 DNA topoisomerase 1 [Bdellovibrio bacteriovorus]CAE78902.1 DNA topoisomerase I [Bdellovibrio bacteriovorus HD100]
MAKKSDATDGIKLVIVESPTKAKTIRKFLGRDYVVESCMGHIRDLPQSAKDIPEKVKKEKWAQLGVNVDKNFEPLYCVPKDKTKVVKNLKDKLEEASELYLATDEDREGESISWHLLEVLKPKVPTKRMVFHEITKDAIQKALKDTREIDFNLVRAQEARRVLDRLVGYTISPLLWKKVAYGLSAGRVQSVAVRLIVERELERVRFKKSSYWGVLAELSKDGVSFESRLQQYKNQRVATGKDFDGLTGQLTAGKDVLVLDEKTAGKLSMDLKSGNWQVTDVEEKPTFRKPAPPFITSTLQQESNRKLGLSSRETMQVAQKLYEQGFITYMRTDSTFLSNEAITASRDCIESKYGKEYLTPQPRNYAAKKVKGAQEAHEAIRPAGNQFMDPDETGLTGTQFRLYDLIWKRTIASQMVDARQKQVSAKITVGDALFGASGMTIEFPGFLRAYVEGSDDPEADLAEREVRLPALKVKDGVKCAKLDPTSHETKPPARYTEASLVQTMEKEGIGRPSTYASVIGTIIDRGYVRKNGTALVPTFTAMIVSKLLSQYLSQYVDLGFTSEMEQSLDNIADGELDWESYLASVYKGPKGLRAMVDNQGDKIDPNEARTMTLEGMDKYKFHVGRYGAYVTTQRDGEDVSASLPDNESPADITPEIAEKLIDQKINGADSLGNDPETDLPVYVLNGRYGPYVQLGDVTPEDDKPKRASLPPGTQPEQVDLAMALSLLQLPKTLGTHPGTGKDIKAGLGRFGPFVVHDGDYRSIPKGESIFNITFEKAMEMLAQPKKGRGRAAPLKELGAHPDSGDAIQVFNGPYGPYIKCGKVNASLPEGATPDTVTLEQAVALINEKGPAKGKGKAKGKAKAAPKAKAAKADGEKPAAKKPALKKAANAKEKAEALGVKKVVTRKSKK